MVGADGGHGFGELLREHRLAAGLTQAALADRAGISSRGIQDLERGLSQPRRDTLARLEEALSLSRGEQAALHAAAKTTPRRRAPAMQPPQIGAASEASGRSWQSGTLPLQVSRVGASSGIVTFNSGNPVTDRLTNLPVHLPSLIGREEAIAQVRERLLDAERGLLTLTGTGGSGKTSLALAVAREVLDSMEFPDGVWLAELAPLSDALLVPGAIASSVGVKEQTGRPIRDTLLDELRLRTLLVVLDNCEHQVETCAALADDLLRTCPGVRILATSREPLRVHGERVWRVPPLPTPDPRVMVAAEERGEEPRGAVVRGASASRSVPVRTDAGDAARLWLPSASVSMAYHWLSNWPPREREVLTPHQILARLDDAFRLLIGAVAPHPRASKRFVRPWIGAICYLTTPRGVASSRWRYLRLDSIWKRRRPSGRRR